ncbi:hypothetical protein OQA88_5242 [Cercophora sp. LCS_1]
MRPPNLAAFLSAAAFLAAPATAQAISGISERIAPFTPLHTAIYTATLAQKQSPQVTTTVVVTLLVPRDVGWPNGATPVTGTAVSHFSAARPGGVAATWAETAEIVWTLAGNGQQEANTSVAQAAPNTKATLAAVYTDYSHYTTEMYGAWSQARFDYVSTYRETIVEEIGANYPATMIQTGHTTIEITVTGGPLRGPPTTFTNPATLVSVRTTTLVQVAVRPTPGSG